VAVLLSVFTIKCENVVFKVIDLKPGSREERWNRCQEQLREWIMDDVTRSVIGRWIPKGSQLLVVGEEGDHATKTGGYKRVVLGAGQGLLLDTSGKTSPLLDAIFSHSGWHLANLVLVLGLDRLISQPGITQLFDQAAQEGKTVLFSWGKGAEKKEQGLSEISTLISSTPLRVCQSQQIPGFGLLVKAEVVGVLPKEKRVGILSFGNINNRAYPVAAGGCKMIT
jgi:hypothetical protein